MLTDYVEAGRRLAVVTEEVELIANKLRDIARAITGPGSIETLDLSLLSDPGRIKSLLAESGDLRSRKVNLKSRLKALGLEAAE